jgi:hypothetical protein
MKMVGSFTPNYKAKGIARVRTLIYYCDTGTKARRLDRHLCFSNYFL